MSPSEFHRIVARAAYEADREDWQKQGVENPSWEDSRFDQRAFYLHRTAIPLMATVEEVARELERLGIHDGAAAARGMLTGALTQETRDE